MEIDNKTAKKVLIRSIQKQRIDADNLLHKRSPTQWQDFPKKADKLLKSSTARVRLEANIKKRGLTPPSARLVNRVLNRSADRLMSNVKNKTLHTNQDRLIRSTGIKDPFKQIEKAWDLNTKSMNKKFMKEALTKTMGNVKKLTPAGLVGAIMQPKKVGDATLKKNINRNPNFPR